LRVIYEKVPFHVYFSTTRHDDEKCTACMEKADLIFSHIITTSNKGVRGKI
jgi:hypothetical protein